MLSTDAQEAYAVYAEAELVHDAVAVEAAVERMAHAITVALGEHEPLVLCVMLGGIVFAGRLIPRLSFPLHVDYVHATRYRGATRGSELTWLAYPQTTMRDRAVLLLDDILDEGETLTALLEYCHAHGARAVHSAVLTRKRHTRNRTQVQADFVGLEVEDRYVFGCGMDYKGYLRNLPAIYAVRGS